MRLPYKPRWVNKAYADFAGYFWEPCPICGEHFGGHEWLPGNTLMISQHQGKGVCPKCGERVKEINRKNGFLSIY